MLDGAPLRVGGYWVVIVQSESGGRKVRQNITMCLCQQMIGNFGAVKKTKAMLTYLSRKCQLYVRGYYDGS